MIMNKCVCVCFFKVCSLQKEMLLELIFARARGYNKVFKLLEMT